MKKKERKNKEKLTRVQTGLKAKGDWIDTQCKETDACLNKNNNEKAYQLVKDLTLEKQGRPVSIQNKSWKCLTEESYGENTNLDCSHHLEEDLDEVEI